MLDSRQGFRPLRQREANSMKLLVEGYANCAQPSVSSAAESRWQGCCPEGLVAAERFAEVE
jgi:hypothetical protein